MNKELQKLLTEAAGRRVSGSERAKQRINFAFGNNEVFDVAQIVYASIKITDQDCGKGHFGAIAGLLKLQDASPRT